MYYFIVNKFGGTGNASKIVHQIKTTLDHLEIEYKIFFSEKVGHAEILARTISQFDDNEIKIIIVGGDGTINEVINGITSFERVLVGIIPCGSGNDFARGMKLFRHNSQKALEQIIHSKNIKCVDLGVVETKQNRRLFCISSGFGLDAIVTTSLNGSLLKSFFSKIHLGKIAYALCTISTLCKMKTQKVKISFDGEPLIEFSKLIFVALMNMKAEGGGIPMCPNAFCDDGKLSICIASNVPKWKTFLIFPFLLLGIHKNLKAFYLRDFKTVDIYSESESVLHTDGEDAGITTSIHAECISKKLRILI